MIDPLVQKWSEHFAGASKLFPYYVSAVIFAEGGMGSILAAVKCSQPDTQTVDKAVEITCRSVVHRMADNPNYDPHTILTYLGGHWAPIGVDNDPKHLNENWIKNATFEFDRLNGGSNAAA